MVNTIIAASNTFRLPDDPVDTYNRYGFAIVRVFDESQVCTLETFARSWVYRLLAKWAAGKEESFPLEAYHVWSRSLQIDHDNVFCAENRHMCPDLEVEKILLNEKVRAFLRRIGLEHCEVWDEGLGWLGFRFIRPGAGDGYPLSRKAWGIAENVASCWIPIIGHSPSETLTIVPGSHLKEYEKYLPLNDKFREGEYRLARNSADLELYNPKLERGQVVFYHPKTLHSENVVAGDITRLSLEFRVNPLTPTT